MPKHTQAYYFTVTNWSDKAVETQASGPIYDRTKTDIKNVLVNAITQDGTSALKSGRTDKSEIVRLYTYPDGNFVWSIEYKLILNRDTDVIDIEYTEETEQRVKKPIA